MKVRISEHNNSFINPDKRFATKLSELMWEEREKNVETKLVWSKVKKARERVQTIKCALCVTKKLFV